MAGGIVGMFGIKATLGKMAMEQHGECCHSHTTRGSAIATIQEMETKISAAGGRMVHKSDHGTADSGVHNRLYVWESGGLELKVRPDETTFEFAFLDEPIFSQVKVVAAECVGTGKAGKAYVVVSGPHGPDIHSVGVSWVELEKSNYSEESVAEFTHVVEDLNSKDPCGRIVILDGKVGTGKTYLVRAMTGMCPNATFIVIPSSMVSDLAGPTILPVLMENKSANGPLVLVIEDADECLVSRGGDNMGPSLRC